MHLKISFVIPILFGVVHANSDSGLGLLRQHSVDAFASRHAVIIEDPPSRIVRNAHLFGDHLEVRSDGCPSGYEPCESKRCCPFGCIPCKDNTKTCCDIGTFCAHNGTKPVCECFGITCPGGNTPPPTSSTHHTTMTSKSMSTSMSTSTSMLTSTGLTTGSVGFSSTTTSLSIPTSSVAPLPSTTTSASGSSSSNAGGKTSAAAAVDSKPPLLSVFGMGIVTLLIEHGIGFIG